MIERFGYSSFCKPLILLTGNRYVQDLLKLVLHVTQHLMGIGSGSVCTTSGEVILLKVLREVSEPPFNIFDVGANKGLFLQLIASVIGDEPCHVHAFEPVKKTFSILEKSIPPSINCITNNFALGATDSFATIYSDSYESVLASLTKRDLTHEGKTFSVEQQTRVKCLDSYCRENNINSIDLLKIDVEGHELDVLLGGNNVFREGRIKILSFEFGAACIDTRIFFKDLFQFVKSSEMDIFRITRSGYLVHITSYHERHEQFITTNFLCIRRDLGDKSRTIVYSQRRKNYG